MPKPLEDGNNNPDEDGSSLDLLQADLEIHAHLAAKAHAEAKKNNKTVKVSSFVVSEYESSKVVNIDIARINRVNLFRERKITKQEARPTAPQHLEQEFQPKRNIRKRYRKAATLPDPKQGHRAEVNLNRKQMKYRTDEERIERLTTLAKQSGLSRDDLLDQIIDQVLKKNPELTP